MRHESSRCGRRSWRDSATSLILLPAVLSLALLAACDGVLTAERRIERAGEQYESGRYAEAMGDLKTALEAEPDNTDARVLLARVSLKLGDPATARKELDRAVESGADSRGVRDLHYAIFLAERRYEDALISAAVDEDLEPLRRHVIMTTAQTGLGKYDDAEESLAEALAIDAGDPEANLVKARLYWATGRLQEAQEALDGLLERKPDYAPGWLYKGRFALGVGDANRAKDAFAKAIETGARQLDFPDQVAALVGVVESRLALGDLPGAGSDLAALQGKAPNAFVTRYLRARVAYAKGENGVAAAELQRALSEQPDSVPARLLLGAALFGDGALEQAEAELNRLISDHPDSVEARKLLARLYMARNDPAAARRILAEIPSADTVDARSDWLQGATLLLSGKTAEAIVVLEQAAGAEPGNTPLKLDLVQAYLAAGRREDAQNTLASIPQAEGGARQRQLALLTELAGRTVVEAKPHIERLVEDNPKDATLLTLVASYFLASGDPASAGRLFEQAVAADPDLIDGRLGLASALLNSGDLNRASEQLRRILDLDPENERAHVGLAVVAMRQGNRAEARDWLERAVSADPAVVESRLTLAEMAFANGDPVRAKAMIDQALAVTKARPQTLYRVGQIYLSASQYDDALARFNDAAGLGVPDGDIGAGLTLIALGRKDEARARFEAAASGRRDWGPPVVYLAALDAGEGRFDQALKRLDQFEGAGGAKYLADEVRGDLLTAAKRPADALDAYERAARVRPSSSLAVKLYRARSAAGRREPEASLKNWLDQNPEDQSVRVLLAEHFQLAGDRKSAIAEYERAMRSAPLAPVMNNLAWLYHEIGDDRAEDLARRAYEAASDNPEIADTYGWILVEKGNVEAGLPVLEAAVKKTTHPEIRFHHGAALARAGKKKEAAEALRKLLGDVEAFPSRAAAQELLDSLSRSELGL